MLKMYIEFYRIENIEVVSLSSYFFITYSRQTEEISAWRVSMPEEAWGGGGDEGRM